jgi:hypothetical protein
MKKNVLTLFIFSVAIARLFGQDLIIKKNGEEIKAKVKSVSSKEIEYSKTDSSGAPFYKIAKAEVLMIMYSNGHKDIFTEESKPSNEVRETTNPILVRPPQRFYAYDFFDKRIPLVYLGIDFSNCKLIGEGFDNPKDLFNQINELLDKEKNKYDLNAAVKKIDLLYRYEIIDKRNDAVIENELKENTRSVIPLANLQHIIDEYDMSLTEVNDGLAMVIICEKLNRIRAEGIYYYVVFDVASKKVLISDVFVGRAGGNGPRNYWARTVYETIKTLDDIKYGVWKLRYRR